MFELGMRLTFRKPTIIVTDDLSKLPFDTRIIEHVPYPGDLHYHKIEEFIVELSKRITSVRDRANAGNYKSFIESFGTFDTVEPTTKSVPLERYVVDRLDELSASIRRLERRSSPSPNIFATPSSHRASSEVRVSISTDSEADIAPIVSQLSQLDFVNLVRFEPVGPDKGYIVAEVVDGLPDNLRNRLEKDVRNIIAHRKPSKLTFS